MSDQDAQLAALELCAAEIRDELALAYDALQNSLTPGNLMRSAGQGFAEKAAAEIDPKITQAFSAHGKTILALAAAGLAFGVGRRAFAKPHPPKAEDSATSVRQGQNRMASLLALVREGTALASMLALLLAPGPAKDGE